jgi:hypothetical protein
MGVVGRLAVTAMFGVGLLGIGVALESPAAASRAALLDTLAPLVTVERAGVLSQVAVERVVGSADTIRTDATGRALITYSDGSTAVLDPASELTIEFVRTDAGDVIVRMQQTLGRVWYAVNRTVSAGSRYEVRSSAMASVIRAGSGSVIVVGSDGVTSVLATEGDVDTTANGVSVTLPAGSGTTMAAGSTPAPPRPAAAAQPAAAPSPSALPVVAAATPAPTSTPGTNGLADSEAKGGSSRTQATEPRASAEPSSAPAPAVDNVNASAEPVAKTDPPTKVGEVKNTGAVGASEPAKAVEPVTKDLVTKEPTSKDLLTGADSEKKAEPRVADPKPKPEPKPLFELPTLPTLSGR